MTVSRDHEKNIPGTHVKKSPSASELAAQYVKEWDEKRLKIKQKDQPSGPTSPVICFSRKLGVGALEIAELITKQTNFRVFDREIIEYMAREADLSDRTVELFDEKYPGKLNEYVMAAFREKSFIQSDYTRHLFRAVIAIAGLGPTIFVGRGTHLILPRECALSVRFIASNEHRIRRMNKMAGQDLRDAEKKLNKMDKEQMNYFQAVYGRDGTDPEHFDLIINLDRFSDPQGAADIVKLAFNKKFGIEIEKIK